MPDVIYLVGSDGTTADPMGSFVVVLRDNRGYGLDGVLVTLNFDYNYQLTAHLDQRFCYNNGQLFPGMSFDCPNHTVSRYTDAYGRAEFRIMGYGHYTPNCNGNDNGARVANLGVFGCSSHFVKAVKVAMPDLDGGGLTGSDLSLFLDDLGCWNTAGIYRTRVDYNGDGFIDGSDLSLWLDFDGGSGSPLNCSTGCQ